MIVTLDSDETDKKSIANQLAPKLSMFSRSGRSTVNMYRVFQSFDHTSRSD